MVSAVIKRFEAAEWPMRAAKLIQDSIDANLSKYGGCSVMLTGGRSAERLYMSWAELPAFHQAVNVHFYFGDERCVSPDHPESNYGMAMRTLFQRGVPAKCSVFRMEAENLNREDTALRYGEQLPVQVDILLLGVGEDGHIASLFPGSAALRIACQRVAAITGPKPPHDRLTITPPVIAQAKSVFVLAAGSAKGQTLHNALQAAGDYDKVPACLVLNAIWLLDY